MRVPMRTMLLRQIKSLTALAAMGLWITIALAPIKAEAEFLCKSSVSYKWKKAKGEEEVEVAFQLIERSGTDEAKAKLALNGAVDRAKGEAFEACKKDHEDLASCISNKYSAYGSTLRSLGFGARKALEDAITSDCTAQEGRCLVTSAADPKCEEIVAAEPEKGGKNNDKGKDAKKK